MRRENAEFWGRIGGMYEPVEVNEVNLEIERKVNEFMDAEVSREEISKFMKTLKNGKAAGMDGIPYEFYKEGGSGIVDGLFELFRKIWAEERVPRKWDTTNYRQLSSSTVN